jgi:hypothetical protein
MTTGLEPKTINLELVQQSLNYAKAIKKEPNKIELWERYISMIPYNRKLWRKTSA